LFVEFLVIFSIFNQFSDHIDTSLGDVLLDDLQDFIVLQELSGNVQGKIFRIDNSLNEVKIFWDQILAVIHNEDSSDVQFNVVLFLFGFEHIEWGSLWEE
jgi:hypothetical protein